MPMRGVSYPTPFTGHSDLDRFKPALWLGVRLPRSLSRPAYERWVICVDVGGLDFDKTLRIFRRWSESFSEEIRDNFNDFGMEPRESL